MAFGQQAGPPAPARQVQQLLALLRDAGHADFRDAHGPMGFTQRQAGGKFTRDEATAFIDRLQGRVPDGSAPAPVPAARLSAQEQLLRRMPAEQLAVETPATRLECGPALAARSGTADEALGPDCYHAPLCGGPGPESEQTSSAPVRPEVAEGACPRGGDPLGAC